MCRIILARRPIIGLMATNSSVLATINTAFKARTGKPTWGVASFTGTGAQTAFNIAHGSGGTPNNFHALPLTEAATAKRTLTRDGTNIIVTYATAPANGASLKFRWSASRL